MDPPQRTRPNCPQPVKAPNCSLRHVFFVRALVSLLTEAPPFPSLVLPIFPHFCSLLSVSGRARGCTASRCPVRLKNGDFGAAGTPKVAKIGSGKPRPYRPRPSQATPPVNHSAAPQWRGRCACASRRAHSRHAHPLSHRPHWLRQGMKLTSGGRRRVDWLRVRGTDSWGGGRGRGKTPEPLAIG